MIRKSSMFASVEKDGEEDENKNEFQLSPVKHLFKWEWQNVSIPPAVTALCTHRDSICYPFCMCFYLLFKTFTQLLTTHTLLAFTFIL